MAEQHSTLLLVDGNALLYRAFHAYPPTLTLADGTPINAVYGFTRILLTTLKQLQPTHLIVCLDPAGGNFRSELDDKYKATRKPMPDEMAQQIPHLHEVIDALEVPKIIVPLYEADDCIGTLCRQYADMKDLKISILSGDQDLVQLITDQVSLILPGIGARKEYVLTPETTKEKYGFEPVQMIEYKALAGDSSDNIPGVRGVGEKSAKALIEQFETVTKLYEALEAGTDDLAAGLRAKLIAGKEDAIRSHDLATIRTDVSLEVPIESARLSLENPAQLVGVFTRFRFTSLLNELPKTQRTLALASAVFEAEETNAPERRDENPLHQKLAPILREMEKHGVLIDRPYLKKLEGEFKTELDTIIKKIHDLAGEEFTINSPKQVAHILYEKMGISTSGVRKGKTGYTTDAETLRDLATEHPIAQAILDFRERDKLLNTYILPLQELADENDRLHTTYAPDTTTARVSSKNPNLQNIPVRTDLGKRIRQAFIAPKGEVLVSADYSQIELRLAAHFSGDEELIKIFKEGRDIHTETAERMGVDRRTAKIINFSVLYGTSAFGFARAIGVSVAEAQEYITKYFESYPKLKPYLDGVVAKAKEDGYVETLLGNLHSYPNLLSPVYVLRSAAEREVMNFPIQGSGADVQKKAIVDLAAKLKKDPSLGTLILTVHDELVLEVPKESAEKAAQVLKEVMESAVELKVPLVVETEIAERWS